MEKLRNKDISLFNDITGKTDFFILFFDDCHIFPSFNHELINNVRAISAIVPDLVRINQPSPAVIKWVS
jgi:hypothetical protein